MRTTVLVRVLALALAPALFAVTSARSQDSYYQAKTIRLIVGTSPGGGFDTYSRAIARHMGRHIPGNPSIAVENMPGAAHLISANHLYKVAKPDGLTFGNFTGALFLAQVLGRPGIEFDARRFNFLGAPSRDISICALSRNSGVGSLNEWRAAKSPVKFGSIGPGDFTYEVPKILGYALQLPAHVVGGYKGTAEIRLAVESGEVDGVCMDWNSIRSTWRKALDSGDVRIVVRITPSTDPEIAKVPLAADFAATSDGPKLLQVGVQDRGTSFRPYLMPPNVPKDRVQILRRAFAETLRDRDFLADAQKSNLNIDAVTGDELEKVIANLFHLEPALTSKLSELLR